MIERVLVPAAATILSLGFFLAGVIAVALVFFGGATPCSPESIFSAITGIMTVIALFAGAVLMERLKLAPSTRRFMIGLSVPILATGLHAIAMQHDASAQQACIAKRDGS